MFWTGRIIYRYSFCFRRYSVNICVREDRKWLIKKEMRPKGYKFWRISCLKHLKLCGRLRSSANSFAFCTLHPLKYSSRSICRIGSRKESTKESSAKEKSEGTRRDSSKVKPIYSKCGSSSQAHSPRPKPCSHLSHGKETTPISWSLRPRNMQKLSIKYGKEIS